MSRLLEDLLSEDDYASIERVLGSLDIRFDKLAALAGLDPQKDFIEADLRSLNFCGADVRGFNFSGSDLRDVAIDDNTKIDESTQFTGARVRWIEEGDIPIVELMMSVEHAPDGNRRSLALAELEKRFGKTSHVVQFVVNAAGETTNLDSYLDFLNFLPPSLNANQIGVLVQNGRKLVQKRLARAKARTRRDKTKGFATAKILDRLRMSDDSFASAWYQKLALVADKSSRTEALKGTVVEPTEQLLDQSLQQLFEDAN